MDVAGLCQALTIYYQCLGSLFPRRNPLRLLRVLNLCRKTGITEQDIIQQTGLKQSVVSQLLKKCRKEKVVKLIAPRQRYRQGLELTETGHKLLADLEQKLAKTPMTSQAQPSSSDRPHDNKDQPRGAPKNNVNESPANSGSSEPSALDKARADQEPLAEDLRNKWNDLEENARRQRFPLRPRHGESQRRAR